MTTIIGALICLGLLAITIHSTLKVIGGPNGSKGYDNYIVNFFTSVLNVAAKILTGAESQLEPIAQAFVTAFQGAGPGIAQQFRAPIETLTKSQFNEAIAVLSALGESTPDGAVTAAATAMAQAFGAGVSSAGATALFEAAFPEKLNTLNAVGPIMAKMAGFDEVADVAREPLYENAFGISLNYYLRSIFKPDLPSEMDAVLWHGRRLLTDDQLRVVFKYSGLKAEYEDPFVKSAYRSVQPRAIATAIQDTPFPRDTMQGLLEFGGYRDQDITLMLDAFEGASTRNVRNQYLSSVTTAAERGTLTPAEVDSALTDLNFSAQAKHWVNLTIATRKLEQLAELYRKSISEAYHYSLITDAQYVPALQAIGIAAADANAHYAVDSEKKLGQQLAADARAAARLAAETTRAEVKAALANYEAHNIDDAALTAALAVAGLPAQIIPWAVDVAALRRQSSLRMVFGKLVTTNDAVLLREQVAAIKEQVIKKLLDIPSARLQLENFGVPPTNAQDLVATWAAQALKTVLPVQ